MGSEGHGADDVIDKIAQMAPLAPPLGHHLLQRLLVDVWRRIPGHPEAHFGRPEAHFSTFGGSIIEENVEENTAVVFFAL